MRFDAFTDTCKTFNEDIFGHTERCFWVLDGALSLSKANYTDAFSDIVWVVNWWNTYLLQNIEQFNKSIVTILEEGIDQLNREFGQYADYRTLSKLDRSTASIIIVRINNNTVECFGLGDSEINIRNKQGAIEVVIDGKIDQLDSQVIDMIFNNNERINHIHFNGYTNEELAVLQNNRMKMNEKDGYYILEHDKSAIQHGHYKEYQLSDIKDIILMSDGYSAIYNKYNQLTIEHLMDRCHRDGVQPIMALIRSTEKSDESFQKYKRLRLHDDATAIYLSL